MEAPLPEHDETHEAESAPSERQEAFTFLPSVAVKASPLVKWPGGKRSLLKHLLKHVPNSYNQYFEPFFGGGALFFALQPSSSTVNDTNPELINLYLQVRDYPDRVISCLSLYKNTEEDYYVARNSVPVTPAARAARTYYLALLAFNGIHRVNLNGKFNVPYSHKTHLAPCEPDRVMAASKVLAATTILQGDFQDAVATAKKGDLVYLDPPYTVGSGKNGFIKYNSKLFSWDDQVRLARVAKELQTRGCTVIVSNANRPSIVELYSSFEIEEVSRIDLHPVR